jgi:hypothetical protein
LISRYGPLVAALCEEALANRPFKCVNDCDFEPG